MATVATGSAGSLVDPSGGPPAGQKQRKKGKFRLKERSSSSVREKFINDPAYTEDVRHLALPMRRNSGPEHDPGRKFYMISKKKSNSVGKDYSRGSGSLQIGGGGGGGGGGSGSGGVGGGSSEFYTLDVESIRRAGLNVPELKPRRKKYNHHSSAELLNRLLNTDESSSSDGVLPKAGYGTATLDRGRGRSLDRRSYTTGDERFGATRGLSISRAGEEDDLGRDAGRQQQHQQPLQRGRKSRNTGSRRENSEQDIAALAPDGNTAAAPSAGDGFPEDIMVKGGDRESGSTKGGRFQIGKRFLKGEIGIKSFNYYLLKEGLKSSKKSLLKQRSAPVAAAGSVDVPLPELPQSMELISPDSETGSRMVEKGEENIYEEIYFEDKPKRPPEACAREGVQLSECQDASNEKIQFIDCELCVQQCSNANCDVCHGLGAQHTAQQHEHHHHQLQQQRQAEQKQQNIYEQLKQHGSGGSSGGSGQSGGVYSKTGTKSLDIDEQIHQRQKQQHQQQQQQVQDQLKQQHSKQQPDSHTRSMGNLVDGTSVYASENVLQYQSYNPSNPNVYKLETTPVAFSCDYSPLQQIYYKQQPASVANAGDTSVSNNPRQHIYQRPHQPGGTLSSGSDYYQELNHKKSSSSSDSLQQQQRRLQGSNAGIYYQRAAAALSDDQHRSLMSSSAGAKIYKVSSNISILSEASGRSEGSYRQPQPIQPLMQSQYQPLSTVAVTGQREQGPPVQGTNQARPQQAPQSQSQPYGRTGGNVSDSSLGDSLFSYPANRRYFGSSESCRFASETCRRCSVEVDKCSFSDTCRYSDCRNCDCSSSYFSSDFDDAGHGGSRSKSGARLSHTQSEAAGYYQAPPYAEDFMKHVSAVKRGNQQQQQQQQQPQVSTTHLMAGGKIYETPPTYVGMMPITGAGLQKPREPTYETLRNPPYSIPMVGPSYDSSPLVASGRLSISQSHEALLSPIRRSRSSRSTDTDQYPQLERRSPVSHYSKIRRPHQSSTLPSSMRSARRHQTGTGDYDPAGYSVIREGPNNTRGVGPGPSGGSTLPKSFSMQQPRTTPMVSGRSASLLTMGHEYAEITKAGGKSKPIPPPISTIPSTREARARSKQQAASNMRAASPSQYARTGPSGIAGSSAGSSSMERKSRDRSLKQGKSAETVRKERSPAMKDQQGEKGKSANREQATGTTAVASGGSGTMARSGKPTTGSTRRKEFVRSQQQQHRSKRPVRDNFTDDEDDDEVFLSDKVYERPIQNNRKDSKESPLALTSTVTAPQTTLTTSLMAPTTPTTTSSGGTGRSSSGATPPTATTTSTVTTTASLSSPSHENARSSGAQAFDFTLQPPTSSSSSSGTQPHSSSSPSAVGAPTPFSGSPLPAPRTKSKQKPELDAGSNRANNDGTQPNESESLRTERPKAPAPSALSGRECTAVADAGQPNNNSTTATDGSSTGAGPNVKTDAKTTTSATLASFDSGVVGEATRRDVVVRRTASGTVNRSKDQSPSTPSAEQSPDQEVLPPTSSEPTTPARIQASSDHVNEPQSERPVRDDDGAKLIGNDECDISDFPLPELPVSSRQDPTSSDSFLTATDAEDGGIGLVDDGTVLSSLETEQRNRAEGEERVQTQQDELDSMHYRTAANGGKPTYLFGENVKKNGIFLNKSGWVQVTGAQQTIQPGRGVPGSYPLTGNERILGTGGSGIPAGQPTAAAAASKVTRKYIEYDENRYTGRPGTGASKLEDLINRNESRGKGGSRPSSQQQRQDNVTILKIDPGSGPTSAASLGNRPACLSIKRNLADGSPPPVTPILSPPPAFQDSQQQHQQQQQQQQQQSNKTRLGDIKPGTRIFLSVVDSENHNPKGMVFSRSFEYDRRNRRPPEEDVEQRGGYGGVSTGPGSSSSTDAFSKSFEYDFNPSGSMGSLQQQQQQQQQPLKSALIRRNRSPTFATLTGNSPNYLTKKEKPTKLSSPIFPKAIPGNSLTVNRATLGYASSESLRKFDKNKSLEVGSSIGSGGASAGHRSRRSQFSTKANSAPGLPYGFRADSVGNQRLNSCDSGARSDYSNDDVDDEDDISEDQSSSLALSYKSSTSYINQMKGRASFTGGSPSQSQNALLSVGSPHGLLKSQRSLTPERLYGDNDEYGSARNLKKQRSLTPEKRSRTPDDRSKRKVGGGDQGNNSSQSSLVSRQSSGSRSSTLERQQLRYDEGYMRTSSRSSSSSSYSRDENVPTTSPSATYRRNQLRGNVRLQPSSTALGGDYKIRRSRSLQLSERSPSRQQMPVQQMPHKVVVRLGTVPPKERPIYATPNVIGRKPGPPTTAQLLSQDSLNLGSGHMYSRISPNSTLDRLRRETASHTLDVVDKSKSFDNNNYGLGLGATGVTHPYEYEFDKSKSFDDNLGMPLADRMSDKRTYVTNEKRSYSHDRVFGSTGTNSSSNEYATSQSSTSRNRSPQTSLFGGLNRLYEPDQLPYELNRVTMARSPVMMGSAYRQTRSAVSRERSPVPGYQKPNDLYLMRQQTPDSEYDERLMTPEYGGEPGPVQPIATFKEAELVKKFLYATKNKVQMHRESAARSAMPPPTIAGTPSSGSCTASSCDFWPHCGVSSAGATASALQVEEHSKEQNAQHLSKSGSDNCLGRSKVKRVPAAEVIFIGGAAEDSGVGGPRGDGGVGGGNSSSNSSNNGSHISTSNGTAIMWPNTSTAAPRAAGEPTAVSRASAAGRAVPVPVKANSYGGVSSFGQQHHYYQQQQHPYQQQQQSPDQPHQQQQQRILRKQQNFEFYDDDGAGPMSYRMSSGPGPAAKSAHASTGPQPGGLSVDYGQGNAGGSNSSNIISTIIKANSITFLGEHEMPITRDRAFPAKAKVSPCVVTIGGVGGSGSSVSGTALSTVKSNNGTSMAPPAALTPGTSTTNGKSHRSNGGKQQRHHQQTTVGNQHGTACTGTGIDPRDGRARPQSTKPRTAAGQATSLATGSIKRKFEMKLKSRSLPKSFMRYSNLTTDDLELSAILTSNAPLQLRAVSSPSISEAPIEAAPAGRGNQQQDARNPHLSTGGANAHLSPTSNVHQSSSLSSSSSHQKTAQTKVSSSSSGTHHPVQVSESVLQKFRKTFSHFKTSKTVAQPVTLATAEQQHNGGGTTMSVDDKQQQQQQQQTQHHHHRFGPLIWRSSKERRKTKSHRRDKCNSGDSGIQVELDNDADQHLLLQQFHPLENHPEGVPDGVRNGDGSPHSQYTAGVPVRRANSAKVSTSTTTSSILKHKLSLKGKDKENVTNISRLSGKSLSQPSGLDCIVASGDDCEVDGRRRRRRQHTRTSTTIPTELDISDSESISSHPDEDEAVAVEDELLVEPVFAEVLFSFRPGGPQELALEKGALVEVLKREAGPWWWGRLKSDAIVSTVPTPSDSERKPSDCGWFPKDFVKIVPTYAKPKQIIIISNSETNKQLSAASAHSHHGACEDDDGGNSASTLIEGGNCDSSTRLMGGLSVASDGSSAASTGTPQDTGVASHPDLTKENIIKELLETEINYVKLLNSLCLGFIKPLREREDIFSVESVNLIFSNLEKIWRFQQTFLDALRLAVPNNRIGEVFLEYQSAFMVYSSYCNSYPRALMELENYANNKEANQILENCRMAENLPELPLSAHLLAPIQRICRYPLHLSELVKHSLTRKELLPTLNLRKCTKSELETMDCREVFEMALSAMRRVTEMVNEGKRHSEYLSRIQARFENFQGPSINVHSTRLFLQTDAIRMSPNLWNNTYTLFLFDRQLVYCKKDLLKRTNYIYKGRIFLDNCRILNLPDGKMFGVTLKNALRLYCDTRNKWFDFCFRSSSSKLRFLNTLSSERQFCGESLFVSELDGGAASCFDDENLSDREYFPYVDLDSKETTENGGDQNLYDMVDSGSGASSGFRQSVASSISSISTGSQYAKESLSKPTTATAMMPPSLVAPAVGSGTAVGGNTLPKKSRKMPKDASLQQQQQQVLANSEYGSNSLGRRKLGNWFRKAKSTNSTPSQSPTHHPMAMSLASIGNNNNHSDSSSQSSLVTGFQQQRTLSTLGTAGGSGPSLSGPVGKDDDKDELLF